MRADVIARLHGPAVISPVVLPRGSTRLADAEITTDHAAALALWVSVGIVIALVSWFEFGGLFAVSSAAALCLAPIVFVARRSGHRPARIVKLLPDVVDMLGRALRSGATLRGALTEVSRDAPELIRTELRPVVEALGRGRSGPEALADWAHRSPTPEVRVVAAALSLACDHEAGTTQALDGVSQTLRDRAVLSAEIKGLTAQASVSMQALVVLPFALLFFDAMGGQQVLRFLLTQPLGQICLAAGLGLNLLGWLWMRWLIRRRLPA